MKTMSSGGVMRETNAAPEELFWYWIAERHSVYIKRFVEKQEKPWTADPILQQYKFTNPFRQLDRGTVWLRENFLEPHNAATETGLDKLALIAFNICWYRMFNWTGTGQYLGWQTEWRPDVIREMLELEIRNQRQVFTGAHIVYSKPGRSKVEGTVDVCTDLWNLRYHVVTESRQNRRLERTFNLLTTVPCVGGFMAYEMVSDMRWTRLLYDATDKMTWANPGPGCLRGLSRLRGEKVHQRDALPMMRELLARSSTALPDWVPELEMREIEHSLCEFDKYCRVKFGEGKPRSSYPGV